LLVQDIALPEVIDSPSQDCRLLHGQARRALVASRGPVVSAYSQDFRVGELTIANLRQPRRSPFVTGGSPLRPPPQPTGVSWTCRATRVPRLSISTRLSLQSRTVAYCANHGM